MKLAEALNEKKAAQERISQLLERATASARHLEGETPAEDAAAVLTTMLNETDALAGLITSIHYTNSVTVLPSGQTITEAIARRAALKSQRELVQRIATAAGGGRHSEFFGGRTRVTELKSVVAAGLDVPALRAQQDALARDHRLLDVEIQQANWATDLTSRV
jgi:hypothetical protein